MEDQAIQTWQLLGAAIGAAVASFLGTWATLIRPMKREIDKPSERLSLFEAEQKRQNARLNKVEERAEKALTKEEFAAYAGNTTQAINSMTEKVGVLTGVIQGGKR